MIVYFKVSQVEKKGRFKFPDSGAITESMIGPRTAMRWVPADSPQKTE